MSLKTRRLLRGLARSFAGEMRVISATFPYAGKVAAGLFAAAVLALVIMNNFPPRQPQGAEASDHLSASWLQK
jgi:hypothetical protein